MQRQKCTKCGTLLDVSRLETGAKFACATCGTVLVVGETVAVKRSLREGPVFKPRAQKTEPVAPTPTRRAAPETAPERPSRAERAPAPKSKVPLFVGLGALVVSGVVIAVVTSRGGAEGAGGGGAGTGSGGAAASARWWEGVSARVGSGPEAELLRMLAEAKQKGYDREPGWGPRADEIHAALLRRNPDSTEANLYYGKKGLRDYPEFDAVWAQMIEHLKVAPEAARAFVERHEAAIEAGKNVWLDAEGYETQRAILDSFVAWRKQLEADPAPEQIAKAMSQAGGFAKEFGAVPVMARPWLLLLASRQLRQADDSDAEKERVAAAKASFEARGQKIQRGLAVVLREFDSRFRQPLGLEPVGKDKVLVFWLVDDRSAYEEQVRIRSRGAGATDLASWFSPRERWTYGHAAADAEPASLLADVASGAVPQLQWHFSKDPKKPLEDYFSEWNGYWFDAGLAEYLGAGAREDSFTGVSARAVEVLKKIRDHAMPFIPVRQLVEQRSPETFERYWSGVFLPTLTSDDTVPESIVDLIRSEPAGFAHRVFRAQAWYLAFFLNEYGSGKYRNAYKDLLMTALRGRHKPAAYGSGRWDTSHAAFADILGLKADADWERLQGEYRDYVNSALSK